MRRRYKIPLFLLAALGLFILGAYLVLTRTSLLKSQINRYLAGYLSSQFPLEVKVGKVGGVPWKSIVLEDVTVDYTVKPHAYRMLTIDRIEAHYRLSNVWNQEWIASRLDLVGVKAVLKQDENGDILFPQYLGNQKKGKAELNFQVDTLRVADGSFEFFTPQRSYKADSLTLLGRCSGSGTTIDFAVSDLRFALPQERIRTQKALFAGQYREGRLWLDSALIQTDSSLLAFGGTLVLAERPQLSAKVERGRIDFGEFKRLTGFDLQGDVAFSGRVKSDFHETRGQTKLSGIFFGHTLNNLAVDYLYQQKTLFCSALSGEAAGTQLSGRGKFDFTGKPERYEFSGRVNHLDLRRWVSTDLASDFNGEVQLVGAGLSDKTLRLNLTVALDSGRLDRYRFHQVRGALTLDAHRATFADDFTVRYKNAAFTFAGSVGFTDSLNLHGTIDLPDLSDFRGQTFIKEPAGRGEATFLATGRTLDPDIQGTFWSDSCWLYQLFSSRLEGVYAVRRFETARQGRIRLSLANGTAWDVPYDSLSAVFTLDSTRAYFDSARFWRADLYVQGDGVIDYADSLVTKLTVQGLSGDYRGNAFGLGRPARISVDTAGYDLNDVLLENGSGTVAVKGRIDYSEKMDLDLTGQNAALGPWTRFFFRKKEEVGGLLAFSGHLAGDFTHPKFNLEFRADSLTYGKARLGNLAGKVLYQNQKLTLEDLRLTSQAAHYTWSGFIPLDLAFTAVPHRVLEAPQEIRFTALGQRFDLVHFFVENIEWLEGHFSADILFTGTPDAPQAHGKVELQNGTCKTLPLVNPVKDVNLVLRLENETVTLEKATGTLEWKRQKGELEAAGTVIILSPQEFDYHLAVTGQGVPIRYEFDEFEGTGNFRLAVTGSWPPLVSGDISVTSAVYSGAFAEPAPAGVVVANGTAQAASPPWDLQLTVDLPGSFRVSNEETNTEFKGKLVVLRENGIYNYLGELETVRGKFYTIGRTFTITQGKITYDNISVPDPKLDITAVTRIRRFERDTAFTSSRPADIDLVIQITNTLSHPVIKPASGSPFSEEDLVLLLGTGGVFNPAATSSGDRKTGISNRLTIGGVNFASAVLSQYAARQFGIETLELSPVSAGQFDLRQTELLVGKYTFPNFYLYGRSRFASLKEQEVGFEYRINRWLSLEGVRDRANLYRFNLNANWEY